MKKVLIVDDAGFIRMMIKSAIKSEFEIVGEAKSGEESIELYKKTKPDAVTMDISLAGEISGIDALAEIKKINPDAVVVMASSMGEKQYIRKSIDLGAADFVVKPFTKKDIVGALKSALGLD